MFKGVREVFISQFVVAVEHGLLADKETISHQMRPREFVLDGKRVDCPDQRFTQLRPVIIWKS